MGEVGLSNADIARITGWHELRVWRLLTGRTKFSADDVEIFASAIGCNIADLYPTETRAS